MMLILVRSERTLIHGRSRIVNTVLDEKKESRGIERGLYRERAVLKN